MLIYGDNMKVIFLVDNYVDKPELCAEHGFSCWIKYNEKNILFDVGQTENIYKNGKILGLDFSQLDCVVLSHGHYDHTGGLDSIFNDKMKIYAHRDIGVDHFRISQDGEYHYIGINRDFYDRNRDKFILNEDIIEIFPDIFLSGKIFRYEPFDSDQNLFRYSGGIYYKDIFSDEQYLVVKENSEYSIFTGCSHTGIVNIIEDFYAKFGKVKIKAVVGGFHLFRSCGEELSMVAKYFLKHNIKKIYTGHCTGIETMIYLKNILGERVVPIKVGLELEM